MITEWSWNDGRGAGRIDYGDLPFVVRLADELVWIRLGQTSKHTFSDRERPSIRPSERIDMTEALVPFDTGFVGDVVRATLPKMVEKGILCRACGGFVGRMSSGSACWHRPFGRPSEVGCAGGDRPGTSGGHLFMQYESPTIFEIENFKGSKS